MDNDMDHVSKCNSLYNVASNYLTMTLNFSIWVGVFGYLIGGILYNRFAKKATGMQQIPHYDFWYGVYDWVKDMTLILGGYLFGFLQSARSRISLRGNSSSNQQYHGLGNEEEHAFIDDDEED